MFKMGTFKAVCFSALSSLVSLFSWKGWKQLLFGGNFNKHTVTLQVISWGMKRSCWLGFSSHLNCCCVVQLERTVLKARAPSHPLGREARHIEKLHVLSHHWKTSYHQIAFQIHLFHSSSVGTAPLFLSALPSLSFLSGSTQKSGLFPKCPTHFFHQSWSLIQYVCEIVIRKNGPRTTTCILHRAGSEISPASEVYWTRQSIFLLLSLSYREGHNHFACFWQVVQSPNTVNQYSVFAGI